MHFEGDFKENEKLAKEHFFNWVKRGNPIAKKESVSKNVFQEIWQDLQREKEQLKQKENERNNN